MAKVEFDIDVHENSLDNSGDSEILGMVDDRSFGSTECERTQLVTQSVLDTNEVKSESYNFRDLSGGVTYKIVQMAGDETSTAISAHSPTHVLPSGEFFVISNPVEVYTASTVQKKVIRKPTMQPKAVTTAKKRDDKRRETHNEVERRRRDKINSWITKLAALVPNSGPPDTASKGGILAKACTHITVLTEKQKRLEQLETDNDKLLLEVLRLKQDVNELRRENASMRVQLAENCILVNVPSRQKGQKS